MCIRLPKRVWPSIACIPIVLYMFGLVRVHTVENISPDRLFVFCCLAVSVAATHHKLIWADTMLTPTLWVWVSLRSMYFLVFPYNLVGWGISILVGRFVKIGHAGVAASTLWVCKLVSSIMFPDYITRPGFMGIYIMLLAGMWIQIARFKDEKSVLFRCIFTNIHGLVAWRAACYSTFPFYARTDIEILGLIMVVIIMWFMGALRFEEEKFSVNDIDVLHPFPHSIKAARACHICGPKVKVLDMETGGSIRKRYFSSKKYASTLEKVRNLVELPPPRVASTPPRPLETQPPLPPPETPQPYEVAELRQRKNKTNGPLVVVGRPTEMLEPVFEEDARSITPPQVDIC